MEQKHLNEMENEDERDVISFETELGTTSKFQLFVQSHWKTISIGFAALAVIVGIFFFMKHLNEKKRMEASAALSRIMPMYEQGDYMKALTGDGVPPVLGQKVLGLKALVEEYGSTPAGKLAALYAGDAFLALNKAGEAKTYYEKASEADSDYLKRGANAGLGACLENVKNYKEAADYYLKAAEMSEEPGIKSRYTYYSGLCYEKLGDKTNAEKMYREVLDVRQMNEFTGFAKSALIRLGMIIE